MGNRKRTDQVVQFSRIQVLNNRRQTTNFSKPEQKPWSIAVCFELDYIYSTSLI